VPSNPHPTGAEARRMADLLSAYGEIKASRYCEILVAAALGGEVMPPTFPGYDVRCPRLGRVQVRMRIKGTDGPNPRISFRGEPADFDVLVAVHLDADFGVHKALAIPVAAVLPHYARRKQGTGLAHVPWADLVVDPSAEDITGRLSAALKV